MSSEVRISKRISIGVRRVIQSFFFERNVPIIGTGDRCIQGEKSAMKLIMEEQNPDIMVCTGFCMRKFNQELKNDG